MKRVFAILALLFSVMAGAQTSYQKPSIMLASSVDLRHTFNTPFIQMPALWNGAGTIIIRAQGVTGSPSGCTVAQSAYGIITKQSETTYSRATAITIGGGTSYFQTPRIWMVSAIGVSAISIQYVCSTYPTSGTADFEFVPDVAFNYYSYTHINSNTNTIIATWPLLLHAIVFNATGASWTFTIYDNTTCSGTVVANGTVVASDNNLLYDVVLGVGLCITTAGTTAGDITVTWH